MKFIISHIIHDVAHIVGFVVGFTLAFLYDSRFKLKKNKYNECSECRWNVMNGGTCTETKDACGQFISLNKGGE